ncbi:ferritin family protein [bacterium]|nr:ferritin family protein [bacterium]
MQQFSIDEIFEIAEQIERNGAKFYRSAAELTRDTEQQRLLTNLAAMEDEHERTFAGLRKQLVTDLKRESVYEPEDIAAQYLWAWADKAVFDMEGDPFAVLTSGADIKEILRVAIGREKESVVYYEGLKGGISVDADRAKVEAIIQEELQHVAMLTRAIRQLQN